MPVQESAPPEGRAQTGAWRGLAIGALVGLAGCASLDSVNPVNWWHKLEGGPIADQRPPPPNADAPYPKLGEAPVTVPAADAAKRGQIADALVGDRANALYDASLAPLPPAPPKLATPKPAPAASTEASNASLPAASAPPRLPPTPPAPSRPATKPAPTTPVRTAPLPPPAAEAASDAAPPIVPEAPPPAPNIAGVPEATAPTLPVPTPPPAPPPPAPIVLGAPVSVSFPAGGAALPGSALPGLKQLALSRGTGNIAITGFGEAKSPAPDAQQAAMPLAMARVRAVAGYLLAVGVPSSALRIDGQAQGSGAVARVIN